MKICLINPPKVFPKNWDDKYSFHPPLGLAYIAAVLKSKGHEVIIIDAVIEDWKNIQELDEKIICIGLSFDKIGELVKKYKPDAVGIGGLTFWKKSIYETAKTIKSVIDVPIIIGGAHASANPEECLSEKHIDYVIIGEGEITSVELIDKLDKKQDVENVNGIGYKKDEKIILNKQREFINDLDSIPFPDRDLLNLEKYFEPDVLYNSDREQAIRWIDVVSSRGCPFNCVFCSAHKITGKKWRYRSAKNVVDEIEQAVKKYNIQEVEFEDENISLSRERMTEICDLIIERKLKIRLNSPQGMRADTLNEEILKKMKKAGYAQITIAPETGVQRISDEVIEKRMDLKKVEEVIIASKKIGIAISCFFVIGLPGETLEDIKKTIKYAKKLRKLGAVNCTFNNALPIPGTRLYHESKKNGYLLKDGKELDEHLIYNRHKHLFKTPDWNPEDIEKLYRQAIKENARGVLFGSKYMVFYRLKRFTFGMIHAPKLTLNLTKNKITEMISGEKDN